MTKHADHDLEHMHTPQDLADASKLHIDTIYRAIHEGRLKATKIGGSLRITDFDARRFLGGDQ